MICFRWVKRKVTETFKKTECMLSHTVAAQPPAEKPQTAAISVSTLQNDCSKKAGMPKFCPLSNADSVAVLHWRTQKKKNTPGAKAYRGLYHAVMQNAANPTAPMSHQTRELVNCFFSAFGWSWKGHLLALVKCKTVVRSCMKMSSHVLWSLDTR